VSCALLRALVCERGEPSSSAARYLRSRYLLSYTQHHPRGCCLLSRHHACGMVISFVKKVLGFARAATARLQVRRFISAHKTATRDA